MNHCALHVIRHVNLNEDYGRVVATDQTKPFDLSVGVVQPAQLGGDPMFC